MDLIITNVKAVDPLTKYEGLSNIFVSGGKIERIVPCGSSEISDDVRTFDASGKIAVPGLVDMHVHFREPGQEYKEDIESGSRAAVKGGFTSVACMPNTLPVNDNAAITAYVINKGKAAGLAKVYPIASITKQMKGSELTEIGELKESGAVAVSDDGRPVENISMMRKAMLYCSDFNMPIISHCEDLKMTDDGVINEGMVGTRMGLRGIPSISEEIMVAREVMLSRYLDVPVHIAHVSSRYSVECIRTAKKNGVKVTCETAPHYFTLTDHACLGFNTNSKVNPPLKTPEDITAIIEGLKDNTIDAIATDHAPHHMDEKRCEFDLAANGISGLETAFALGYTNLVIPGYLTLEALIGKMSRSPAEILNIPGGRLLPGESADITIIDTNEKYVVDVSEFVSKGKNSPFEGFELMGKVKCTFRDGIRVYTDGGM